MRSVLVLSLLMTLCASANAATVHHAARRHAVAHPNGSLIMGPASGWAYAPPRPRVQSAPAPYYNDQPDPTVDSPYKNWGG